MRTYLVILIIAIMATMTSGQTTEETTNEFNPNRFEEVNKENKQYTAKHVKALLEKELSKNKKKLEGLTLEFKRRIKKINATVSDLITTFKREIELCDTNNVKALINIESELIKLESTTIRSEITYITFKLQLLDLNDNQSSNLIFENSRNTSMLSEIEVVQSKLNSLDNYELQLQSFIRAKMTVELVAKMRSEQLKNNEEAAQKEFYNSIKSANLQKSKVEKLNTKYRKESQSTYKKPAATKDLPIIPNNNLILPKAGEQATLSSQVSIATSRVLLTEKRIDEVTKVEQILLKELDDTEIAIEAIKKEKKLQKEYPTNK